MKKIKNSLLVFLFAYSVIACNNTQSNNNQITDSTIDSTSVEVYYFHGTRRCPTCIAVGELAMELVKIEYENNPGVGFVEINIDEPENEEIAEKFQVSGSGLYVYNGRDIENITAYAFQHAIVTPDKLKKKLIELIDMNL